MLLNKTSSVELCEKEWLLIMMQLTVNSGKQAPLLFKRSSTQKEG